MKVFSFFLVMVLFVFNTAIKAETLSAGKPVDIVVYRSPTCDMLWKMAGTFEKKQLYCQRHRYR